MNLFLCVALALPAQPVPVPPLPPAGTPARLRALEREVEEQRARAARASAMDPDWLAFEQRYLEYLEQVLSRERARQPTPRPWIWRALTPPTPRQLLLPWLPD